MNIIPTARTPLSKEVAKSLSNAEKEIRTNLAAVLTPWKNAHEERRKNYASKYGIKPGEIAVVYGKGEADIAKSFATKDTRIVKE